MKKTIVALVAGVLVMSSGFAFAAGGQVRNTLHNLSATLPTSGSWVGHPYQAATETQICVFCHTPHNSLSARPLWNRDLPTAAFRMYTTASLRNLGISVSAPGPESLMCLSCHDGVTAINVVHQKAADLPTTTIPMSGGVTNLSFSSTNIGNAGTRNLTNDHPISFSYTAAQASAGAAFLNPISAAKTAGMRFFGAKGDQLECSSCHDPHVTYGLDKWSNPTGGNANLRPFLNASNANSALCLACHNK